MKFSSLRINLLIIACSFLFIVSCAPATRGLIQNNTHARIPMAEVLFRVKIPAPIPEGSKLMMEILDDVSGIYFNSSRFNLSLDSGLDYSIRIPLPASTDIKYRYVLVGDGTTYEFNSQSQQVRFRIARINGPEIIEDQVSGWASGQYSGPVGSITGQIIDSATNAPIPNLLISAGGVLALTTSDGTFEMIGLAAGKHNLVVYSMDGAYETFQQGAVVAENALTPVQLALRARDKTKVTFEVVLPFGMDKSLPLRFVSNLQPLGNAYAELAAGSAGSAVNYPQMKRVGLNRYSMTLDLPVGFYLRYKYSFGDGFWNAELDKESKFRVRDLLVTKNLIIKDRVFSFSAKGTQPVHLLVQAPVDTPAQETVFVQLNPFGWMEPLPMVPVGNHLWKFTIFSPLQYFPSVQYRYCRNGLCELAAERADLKRVILPGNNEQTLNDVIFAWQNVDNFTIDTTQYLTLEAIQPKPGFIAGVELTSEKSPAWRNSIDEGLKFAAKIGGDWVVLTPSWTYAERGNLPELFPSPDHDLLWTELMNLNSHVVMNGQKTILFPVINYAQVSEFKDAPSNSVDWGVNFSEQYQKFINHHADLAQMLSIEGLIIGGMPLPGNEGTHLAGQQFGEVEWDELITGVRQRYSGRLIAAVYLDANTQEFPAWLSQVDILYVVYSPKLFQDDPSIEEMRHQFDAFLTNQVQPLQAQFGKPVLIGFEYPSMSPDLSMNLAGQAKAYSAAIMSVASQSWISGFISRGFNPYVELQDNSATIYRKPASEILWFWFHYLLNKPPE
jgi:hypothetical protein